MINTSSDYSNWKGANWFVSFVSQLVDTLLHPERSLDIQKVASLLANYVIVTVSALLGAS